MQLDVAVYETVTAGTVFAVAGIPHMDLCKFARHAVTVELAFRHAAGNAAVDIVFHILLLIRQYGESKEKYQLLILTNIGKNCKIKERRRDL